MLNSLSFADSYDCEKLRILQSMNDQIEVMAVKLDQIVTHIEENHFKIQSTNRQLPANSYNSIKLNNQENLSTFNHNNPSNHQIVTMNNDQVITSLKMEKNVAATVKKSKVAAMKVEQMPNEPKPKIESSSKRNKQQRQFNTFVRDSINQLLGHDFMRTHDVQDIDSQVMEMIRKEAVENYLPENIRPRRAWHLAKASLRTLKRTLNNRK